MKDQPNPLDPPPSVPSSTAPQRLTTPTAASPARHGRAPSQPSPAKANRSLSAALSRAVLPAALLPTLLPTLLSCNADGTTPTLLDSEGRVVENPEPVSEELARLRKLQEVTWTVDDGTGAVTNEGPAADLIEQLGSACSPSSYPDLESTHPCYLVNGDFNMGNGCGFNACTGTFKSLCTAHRLLEVADSLTDVGYTFTDTNQPNVTVTIPPQSAPARADLRKEAMTQARNALVSSFSQLLGAETSASCAATGSNVLSTMERAFNGVTAGSVITQQAIEAMNLYREAAKSAAYEVVNYAETFRAHPTQSEAVRNSMAGEELSRAEAVHLLLGGSSGLEGHPGMCTYPNLTPTEQAVTEVLIDEGICPDDFKGELSPERIEQFVQASANQGVLASQLEAVTAAQALSQQATALGASSTASYTDAEGNTVFTGLQQPNDIDAMYYAAIGRYYADGVDDVPRSDTGATAMPSLADLENATNYADVLDIAGQILATLVGRTWAAGLASSVEAPLAMELAAVDAERLGRVKFCTLDSDYYPGQVMVWGYSTADHLLVVNGEDGLKCAVNGNIDGTPCDLFASNGAPTTLVFANLNASFDAAGSGFESAVAGYLSQTATPEGKRAYLVRPKDGLEQAPGNYEALAAGTFFTEDGCDVVPIVPELNRQAGEWLRPNKDWCTLPAEECDGTFFDDKIPLEDELTDDGDGVENSWKHYLALAKQAADEADLLGQQVIDEGLALDSRDEELELRQHNQDVEAIRELDELQSICGTDVDPYALLDKMGTRCDFASVVGGVCNVNSDCSSQSCLRGRCIDTGGWLSQFASCVGGPAPIGGLCTSDANCAADETCITSGAQGVCFKDEAIDRLFSGGDLSEVVRQNCSTDGQCDDGYVCRAGKCTMSPAKAADTWKSEPEIARLDACLGTSDTVVPAVALGENPLCYWFHPDYPTQVCTVPEGYQGGGNCPEAPKSFSSGTPDCAGTLDLPEPPAGGPPLQVAATQANLGYFSVEGNPPPPSSAACEALRTWRANPTEQLLTAAIQAGFNGIGLESAAQRISWREGLDGHGTVDLGGTPWAQFSTGDIYRGPSSIGICQPTAGCNSSILRCSAGCGANRYEGTALRMRDAVVALKLGFSTGRRPLAGIFGFMSSFYNATDNGSFATYVGRAKFQNAPLGDTHYIFHYAFPNIDIPVLGASLSVAHDTFVWNSEELGRALRWEQPTDIVPTGVVNPSALRQASRRIYPLAAEHPDGNDTSSAFFQGLLPQHKACSPSGDGECWLYGYMLRRSRGESAAETEVVPEWRVNAGDQSLTIRAGALLDGLELGCEAVVESDSPYLSRIDLSELPSIDGAADLSLVGIYLENLAKQVGNAGSQLVIYNVPSAAVDALRDSGSSGTFPQLGGQYASAVSSLRSALVRLSDLTPQLAAQVRQLRYDVDSLQARLELVDVQQQQAKIEYKQAVANNIANCATAAANSIKFSLDAFGAAAAAVATCINGAYQSELAGDLLGLKGQEGALQDQLLFAEFRGQFDTRAESMREISKGMSDAVEQLDAQLAAIENLRLGARRRLTTALQTSSYQAQSARFVNRTIRSRFTTTRARHKTALAYAKKMSILARRAIETRLGTYLADMKEDLPLVEAPSKWAPDVCTAVGIDYNRVRESGEPVNYSAQFIGDYIRKLEAVVESYRLRHNFHEGSDTTIASLRDDVLRVQDASGCSVSTRNLLYASENLQTRAQSEGPGPTPGWTVQDCPLSSNGTPSLCLSTEELPEVGPLEANNPNASSVRGYRVTFGAVPTPSIPTPACPDCNPISTTRLQQTLDLLPGTYHLAWYARKANELNGTPTGGASVAAFQNGTKITGTPATFVELDNGWTRYYVDFVLNAPAAVSIALVPEVNPNGTVSSQQVDLGAISLESAAYSDGQLLPPRDFEPTGLTRTREAQVCQDTDGDKFRADWIRRCLTLCNNGFSGECPQTDAKEYCFMETSFDLNQKQIELGNQLTQSGFARGNFNYRIEDIAVNFVGTDLRSCENSDLPQTCFAAGFIPYSLVHTGKYTVRNHAGESFDAKLYEGNIEHARGLATERYLSNPLSDADSSLLSQYMRSEFKGRPLDGTFVIRVWEDDQFSFEKIQDVQLVLKYRYWTRFN